MIRVLIVDDHALIRSGLRLLLDAEDDITVQDEAGNAEEGVRKTRLHKPDVVVLDIVMPGRSGLDVVAEIKQAAPQTAILVLSMHDDQSYVREAFASGVSGYLLKDAADSELVTAIHEVAAGRQYLHPLLGARLASVTQTEQQAAGARRRPALRTRTASAAPARARAHKPRDRASMLYISVRTAETHRAHIMQKLHLSTRSELVRHAAQEGLLTDETPA